MESSSAPGSEDRNIQVAKSLASFKKISLQDKLEYCACGYVGSWGYVGRTRRFWDNDTSSLSAMAWALILGENSWRCPSCGYEASFHNVIIEPIANPNFVRNET
jgi:hypothetical protein